MKLKNQRLLLTIIVISQFFCTSLWFAGNAVIADLVKEGIIHVGYLSHLLSAVQFGFIAGTFLFALFAISDEFSPSKVFCACAIFASICNLGFSLSIPVFGLLIFRFFTGFFLAGIYPVGMKIAADYFERGLGRSLGFLVGALVLGTAFPHLLKSFSLQYSWRYVIYGTSFLAVTGGLMMFIFVEDGPYRKRAQKLKLNSFFEGFKNREFRAAAFGYFGHMWELYTFWAFVPLMIAGYNELFPGKNLNVSFFSFLIIASGTIACFISGMLSQYFKAKKLATLFLLSSGSCCLLSPLMLNTLSTSMFLTFLFFWGFVVVADSPLFSTVVAQNAPPESKGTALTIVNCVGFSITIISIQFLSILMKGLSYTYIYMFLGLGPILGLTSLLKRSD